MTGPSQCSVLPVRGSDTEAAAFPPSSSSSSSSAPKSAETPPVAPADPAPADAPSPGHVAVTVSAVSPSKKGGGRRPKAHRALDETSQPRPIKPPAPGPAEVARKGSASSAAADVEEPAVEQQSETQPFPVACSAKPAPSPTHQPCTAWTRLAAWLVIVPLHFASNAATLWAIALGLLLVLPLRLLGAPPRGRLLSAARALAQRPLLAFVSVLAPLELGTPSWGLDFDDLLVARAGGPRPATLPALLDALRGPAAGRRALRKAKREHAAAAKAGVVWRTVSAAEFWPGVPHRRLILSHAISANPGAPLRALYYVNMKVALLHTLDGDCFEFRDASSGSLVAFGVLCRAGGYASGTVHARCSLWGINCHAAMELCAADGQVRLLDVGPTMDAAKAGLGLHTLSVLRALSVALRG